MGGKPSAASINKYMAKTYDRIGVIVPKGNKVKLKAHADQRGESLNSFINRAINETVERDSTKPPE